MMAKPPRMGLSWGPIVIPSPGFSCSHPGSAPESIPRLQVGAEWQDTRGWARRRGGRGGEGSYLRPLHIGLILLVLGEKGLKVVFAVDEGGSPGVPLMPPQPVQLLRAGVDIERAQPFETHAAMGTGGTLS